MKKFPGEVKFPRNHTASTNARLFICCVNPESTNTKSHRLDQIYTLEKNEEYETKFH